MLALLGATLTQALHLALILAAAPLLIGLIGLAQARLAGRRGPSPLQPLRDLAKLMRKRPVLAENASAVSRAAPYVAAGATVLAAALVPGFARGMLFAPLADLVLVAGLLALARVAVALAAMDAGTAFGGLGAARAIGLAALAEPALLLGAMTLAMLAGTTNLDAIAGVLQEGGQGLRVSLGLALLALLGVAVAECGRAPLDGPTPQPELATVREAMLLEASGRHLALWHYQAALRLALWLALLAAVFLPFGMAPPGAGPLAWVAGLLAWAAKLAGLGVALAVVEAGMARMRLFRVPEFLGMAALLGLLGAIILFVGVGLH